MTNKSNSGYGMVAAKGMVWMSTSVILTKITAFLCQWGIAFFLEPHDFGLYALIVSFSAFVAGFLDSGINKLLVQRKDEFDYLAVPSLHLSLILSIFGSVILLLLGYLFIDYYNEPQLFSLIAVLVIANPFFSAHAIYKAKINADLKFRHISLVDIFNAFIYSGILFGLAYFGAGPYSFVIALAISRVYLFVVYFYLCGSVLGKGHSSLQKFIEILRDLKWLIASTFLLSLTLRGDYFVIGLSLDSTELGYYYFGFLITASFGLLLSQGVQGVLMPVFSSMQGNLSQMRNSLIRSSSTIILFCGILSITLIVGLPRLIDVIWFGKWNGSIFTAVLMAISLPIRMLSPLGGSVLVAKGSWQARTIYLGFDAITLLTAAFLGAHWYGLDGAAIFVCIHRVTFGLILFLRGFWELEAKITEAIKYVYFKNAPFLFVVFILLYLDFVNLSPHTEFTWNEFAYLTQVLCLSLIAFLILSFYFNKEGLLESAKMAKKVKAKIMTKG
jgi:PST family polysaccharide transporter